MSLERIERVTDDWRCDTQKGRRSLESACAAVLHTRGLTASQIVSLLCRDELELKGSSKRSKGSRLLKRAVEAGWLQAPKFNGERLEESDWDFIEQTIVGTRLATKVKAQLQKSAPPQVKIRVHVLLSGSVKMSQSDILEPSKVVERLNMPRREVDKWVARALPTGAKRLLSAFSTLSEGATEWAQQEVLVRSAVCDAFNNLIDANLTLSEITEIFEEQLDDLKEELDEEKLKFLADPDNLPRPWFPRALLERAYPSLVRRALLYNNETARSPNAVFCRGVAGVLVRRLLKANGPVGVAWGTLLAKCVEAMRGYQTNSRRPPLEFIPLRGDGFVAGPTGSVVNHPPPEICPSRLAYELSRIVNGEGCPPPLSLNGVPPIIPHDISPNELPIVWKLFRAVNTQVEAQHRKMELIVTALGPRQPRSDITHQLLEGLETDDVERLKKVWVGDIAGLPLAAKEDSVGNKFEQRLVGATRQDFKRAVVQGEGVLVIIDDPERVPALLACFKQGLASEAIMTIDVADRALYSSFTTADQASNRAFVANRHRGGQVGRRR